MGDVDAYVGREILSLGYFNVLSAVNIFALLGTWVMVKSRANLSLDLILEVQPLSKVWPARVGYQL